MEIPQQPQCRVRWAGFPPGGAHFPLLMAQGTQLPLQTLVRAGWDQCRQGGEETEPGMILNCKKGVRGGISHLLPQPVGTGVFKGRTALWTPQQVR